MGKIFVNVGRYNKYISRKNYIYCARGNLSIAIFLVIAALIFVGTSLRKQQPSQVGATVQKSDIPIVSETLIGSQSNQTDKLDKYLTVQAALLGATDNISYYFQDLTLNKEVSFDPTRSWIPASTIKAFAAIEAFRQRNIGLLNFDQIVTINGSNVVATELEADEFPRLREGTQVTVKELVDAMIIQSDNTAYNTLLDILDRRNINATLRSLGITETVVGEKLNLDNSQFRADLQVPGRQANTTTVKDLSYLFSLLYSHKIGSSEEILSVFKRQKINNMIPALLPNDVVVAHKTGDWAPIYHDGGIIYKPSDPFIFVVFTNAGDPAVISKMTQVAYYQDAKYVDRSLSLEGDKNLKIATSSRPIYYLKNLPEKEAVLAEKTDLKFPPLTAEDLGITVTDLKPGENQVKKVGRALVTSGSLLYGFKNFFENSRIYLSNNSFMKTESYLQIAKNRLSEINTLSLQKNSEKIGQLLTGSETSLQKAVELAKTDPNKDTLMIEIKKVNDLHYAVLSRIGEKIPDDKKEQFINDVYDFYKKNKTEVVLPVKSYVLVNPIQQKPTIGVVSEVKNDQIKIKLDDGTIRRVAVSDSTNVRSFGEEKPINLKGLKLGLTIAVLGSVDSDQRISAQFILNEIPEEVTKQRKGMVTEINPNQDVIKIINSDGQTESVQIEKNTSLKSSDTNVTLEGIKAGSQVTIYGVAQSNPTTSPPNSSKDNTKKSQPVPPSTIKATSVTITGNNSGKKEEKSKPSEPPSKPEQNQKPQEPPKQQPTNQKQIEAPKKEPEDKSKK